MAKLLKFVVVSLSIFGLMMTINILRFQYGISDGFWRTLMTPFVGTIWAPNFSEANFSKVILSMSQSQVEELLGNPVRKECGDDLCIWVYATQDSGTADYDQRWVIFDAKGVVIEKRKSFFID